MMNAKMKGALILGLVLIAVASALYIAPTLAHMNGDVDQTQDRDRLRDRDCSCVCLCDQDQTQTRLRTRECLGA
jgi:hypothetical protein